MRINDMQRLLVQTDTGSHVPLPRDAVHRRNGVSKRGGDEPEDQVQSFREGVPRCQGETGRFADLSAV
jgi:hypothetical protein